MYSYKSRIRYSELDESGHLRLESLLDYFQDCSTFQSEDIGLGVDCLKKRHLIWVMSSWQIVVERYPDLCEWVTIGTIPYDFKGFLGFRNFLMTDEEGRRLASTALSTRSAPIWRLSWNCSAAACWVWPACFSPPTGSTASCGGSTTTPTASRSRAAYTPGRWRWRSWSG